MCQHWDTIRWELEDRPMHSILWSACERWLYIGNTTEMCSTGMAKPLGTLLRETVLEILAEAPFLLPSFSSSWQTTGTVLWTRGPIGWHQHVTRRGVPQGSPVSCADTCVSEARCQRTERTTLHVAHDHLRTFAHARPILRRHSDSSVLN